jgi:hypothetical protein
MKNKIILSMMLLAAMLFIQSCGHTNKLGKYDLSNQKVLYDKEFEGTIQANLYLHNQPVRTGNSTADFVIDVGKAIVGGVVEGSAESKLIKAADPDAVAGAISDELSNSMVKYLNVSPTNNPRDGYNYIVTTRVKDITLNSTEFDIFLHLNAEVEITEKGSADIVWDYCDSKTVSLRNYLSRLNNGNFSPNVSDVIQMAQLLALPQEQLRQVVNFAAQEIGEEITRQFRKDLSKARGK